MSLQRFKSTTFTKVAVTVGQEYTLTARLKLGNVSENGGGRSVARPNENARGHDHAGQQ